MLLSWAKLLKRVFDLDLEHGPNCGGELKIIAAILEAPVIEKILTHLGLQADCGRRSAPASAFSGKGQSDPEITVHPYETPMTDTSGRH